MAETFDAFMQRLIQEPCFVHYCSGKPAKIPGKEEYDIQPDTGFAPRGDLSYHPGIEHITRQCGLKLNEGRTYSDEHRRLILASQYLDHTLILKNKTGIRESGGVHSARHSLLLKEEEMVGDSREYPYHTTRFEAMVLGSLIDTTTYAVRTYWSDTTHDPRGAFVRYALLVPAREHSVIQTLAQTPSLLLDCFKAMYPDFDNSAGMLRLRIRDGEQYVQFNDVVSSHSLE